MKTIGIIGGMSWESTVTYYQIINETVKRELGGFHSAKILLYSVDFDEIEKYQTSGDWEKSGEVLADIAARLEQAGADYIVIATNTMHKVIPQMKKRISIPIIHIAEATADKLKENGISTVGLLGTKYTMKQDFYKEKLVEAGLKVIIPNDDDVETVNDVIYNELCLGNICPKSKEKYIEIINKMAAEGAQDVILGCTEIGLLIKQEDVDIPVFDTTLIHAEKAAKLAIN